MTTSLWLASEEPTRLRPQLAGAQHFDTVVVGGGITGLCTAALLARAGQRVCVVEARRVGSGATGRSTAKVSVLQGTKLGRLRSRNPRDVVAAYVEGNREGQAWLRRHCDAHGVRHEVRADHTYATTADGIAQVERAHAAALEAGLPVEWSDQPTLPFPVLGATVLPDQLQVDPVDVVRALADELVAHGGEIFEQSHVREIRASRRGGTVRTDGGTASGDRVVVATGSPIVDRGAHFARLTAQRSYAAAFTLDDVPPTGMYLSADDQTRSLRSVSTKDGHLLLVGGEGHGVGRVRSERARLDRVVEWAGRHFDTGQPTHAWSAQDYQTIDGLPYVGPAVPASPILVATGYDKWGLTNGVAAALALSARVLGGATPWADAWESSRLRQLGALPHAVAVNADVGARWAAGWATAATSTAEPPDGGGSVRREGARPIATCRVEGREWRRSAVCTHLGGIVRWNDEERSWDCPLHGSRFAPDGEVIEGPATTPLGDGAPGHRGTAAAGPGAGATAEGPGAQAPTGQDDPGA